MVCTQRGFYDAYKNLSYVSGTDYEGDHHNNETCGFNMFIAKDCENVGDNKCVCFLLTIPGKLENMLVDCKPMSYFDKHKITIEQYVKVHDSCEQNTTNYNLQTNKAELIRYSSCFPTDTKLNWDNKASVIKRFDDAHGVITFKEAGVEYEYETDIEDFNAVNFDGISYFNIACRINILFR